MQNRGLNELLYIVGIGTFLATISIFGIYKGINYFFVDNSIRVEKPLVPNLEIDFTSGKPDTTWVYQIP